MPAAILAGTWGLVAASALLIGAGIGYRDGEEPPDDAGADPTREGSLSRDSLGEGELETSGVLFARGQAVRDADGGAGRQQLRRLFCGSGSAHDPTPCDAATAVGS